MWRATQAYERPHRSFCDRRRALRQILLGEVWIAGSISRTAAERSAVGVGPDRRQKYFFSRRRPGNRRPATFSESASSGGFAVATRGTAAAGNSTDACL